MTPGIPRRRTGNSSAASGKPTWPRCGRAPTGSRHKIDADGAATDADLTEAYAYDAIDFALDAIEEAEYAVLDAMYARAAAAALGV